MGHVSQYTAAAYTGRTSFPCATLSFRDIGEGTWPSTATDVSTGAQYPIAQREVDESVEDIASAPTEPLAEMVVCSFALHLVESPSELFSLLWELSTKARWLVILAPHKKPEVSSTVSIPSDIAPSMIVCADQGRLGLAEVGYRILDRSTNVWAGRRTVARQVSAFRTVLVLDLQGSTFPQGTLSSVPQYSLCTVVARIDVLVSIPSWMY